MTQSSRIRRQQRGFLLLEALVAILIFSIGVLGLVGLQASMTKAQTGSKYRADAAFLAQRLIGSMWIDRNGLDNYDTGGACNSHERCRQWVAEVANALPGGAAAINVTTLPGGSAGGSVTAAEVAITINWTQPGEETHRYTTVSAVATNR
jgi:type IV pilus assembly protein PilV